MKKVTIILLSGLICALGVTSVLAQNPEPYNLDEYEQMVGKKLEFNQAPMLKTLVAAGELPPLAERLPQDPLVVEPVEEIGQYGGTMRIANGGPGVSNYGMDYGFIFLASYSADMSKIYPNVLKGWDASADAKTFTLYLRKGMKWSDGAPFTADDLLFYWEDVALNKDIYPVVPDRGMVAREPGVLKKIDDYTVEWSFSAPFGVFIENLARWRPSPYLPKHYLKQFHPKYTPMSEIEEEMKKGGYDTWVALFQGEEGGGSFWGTPGRPVLGPWVAQNEISAPLQVFTRNPYFWKVDTEGNQLPYIDKVTRFFVRDAEAALLKTLAGEFDMKNATEDGSLGGLQNYPLLVQNAEKADYRLIQSWWPASNQGSVFPTLSHKDPVLRKLFNDKNFRIALSVALNRDEVNQVVYLGLGTPSHPTASEGPPFYGEKFGKQYLQYDPELANQLLDELGLDQRDKEGYRLYSDGERLRMVNQVVTIFPQYMDMAELYRGYWKDVGIEVVNKPVTYEMFWPGYSTGEFDLLTFSGTFGGRPMNPLLRMGSSGIYWYTEPLWEAWINSDGEQGEKPPPEVFQIIEIREKALKEPDEAKRNALVVEIFEIHEEAFWNIGGLNEPQKERFAVVQNRLRNVPSPICAEWIYSIPSQYFIKE